MGELCAWTFLFSSGVWETGGKLVVVSRFSKIEFNLVSMIRNY